MATSQQKRPLAALLRSLGEDDRLAETPKLDTSRIVLVAQVDNLERAHSAVGFARMIVSFLASSGAATFSACEFTPDEGLWIRAATVTGANARINLQYGGSALGAFSVNDSLTGVQVVCGRPEDTDFPGFTQTTIDQLVLGTATIPKVFKSAALGQAAAIPFTGPFIGQGTNTVTDLWIPPGTTCSFEAQAVNVPLTVILYLDLPAENFFT